MSMCVAMFRWSIYISEVYFIAQNRITERLPGQVCSESEGFFPKRWRQRKIVNGLFSVLRCTFLNWHPKSVQLHAP